MAPTYGLRAGRTRILYTNAKFPVLLQATSKSIHNTYETHNIR